MSHADLRIRLQGLLEGVRCAGAADDARAGVPGLQGRRARKAGLETGDQVRVDARPRHESGEETRPEGRLRESARAARVRAQSQRLIRPTGQPADGPSGRRMPIETASGQAQCPECFADVTLTKVMQNEITQCPGCGAELEITALEPIALALAPQEEEDWGE